MAKRAAPKLVSDDAAPGQPAEVAPPRHPVTTLEQVFGQAGAKRLLQAAMASGRVHHAWIFHGPAGVGKRTAAVAFAAALLDPTLSTTLSGELAPEEGSPVQMLVRSGSHPDLHVINKELAAISRDDKARDGKQITLAKVVIEEFVIEPAARSRVLSGPAGRAGKVFIIDDADAMTVQTQNLLLKTLEEPPEGTVIILVSSAEDRLLPTIRSRCQRVAFVPLEDANMTRWLARRGDGTGVGGLGAVPPETRQWVLRFSCGSPGVAEAALENDLMAWEAAIGPKLDQVLAGRFVPSLGGEMAKMIDDRAAAVVKQNPDASKDAANKLWGRRMLAFVAEALRSRLRAMTTGRAKDELESDIGVARVLSAIEAVQAAEGHLATNVNLALLLENLVAQMSADPLPV
ncbi:MAG: AAA family ATPase [Phycisphaerales bacterium]|nr:AAA family ATPase [Phycisphaerales bacterium]